ncbi:MAG: hypothetical protein MR051_02845 [Lentisphaeria bacterium]|nr:hypothetical protein [Lentisphaeria bacterium]
MMKKLEYDYPALEDASFGTFICGDTPMTPGPSEDGETDDLGGGID